MSVPPQMIAQMLQSQGAPQGQQGIQGSTNAQSGAALLQKIMMIQALKNQQQPGQQPTLPGSPNGMTQGGLNANPSIPGQMVPQQMLQQQMPGGTNA